MTPLTRMLAPWDDPALCGMVAKGIVIRAGKDAARAEVAAHSGDAATVTTGEATVTIAAPDLTAARCSCGTPFPCRHIITAIVALRRHVPAAAAAMPGPIATPQDDIGSLPFEQIERFAGTAWPRALAMTAQRATISGEATRAVTFAETSETVTFPAGVSLNQALYKGKTARRRLAVAAAALVLARAAGRRLPEASAGADTVHIDPITLDRAEAALGEAARALAAGAVSQAAGRLFTLAISARAEAIPRLAAELRGLSKRMTEEALRQASETPETLMLALGRTHALVQALRKTPDDPALLGVLARSFTASGPMDLTYLGGEHWRTAAGARGLTCVFLDESTGCIHRATEARAAGTDLTFEPRLLWSAPLWSLAPRAGFRGRRLHLPDAALAPDGGLGLTQIARDAGPQGELSGLATWHDLHSAFDAQMGRGLRRKPGEAMLLLEPATTLPPVFDPYLQRWLWTWQDRDGGGIDLILPKDMASPASALDTLTRRVARGLVALAPGGQLRLVALWLTGSRAGHYCLQIDRLPTAKGWTALVDKVHHQIAPPAAPVQAPPDPLRLALDRAAEATLASLSRPAAPRPVAGTRAIGLSRIADALDGLDGQPGTALPLAYLLSLAGDAVD